MAKIILADDGITFDGKTPEQRALGGAESSVICLVEELAKRGHEVLVFNKCAQPIEHKGVRWSPIGGGVPDEADLYIANRGDKLIGLVRRAKRRAFWIHNPAGYLLKRRYLWKLWRWKPAMVFIGDYHASTYPWWGTGGRRVVIPYGIPDLFRGGEPASEVPPPRAIFVSNPLRSLDWLITLWAERIRPAVPGAELHLFTGAATYGEVGDAKAREMIAVLEKARSHARDGVVLRPPVPKQKLVAELRAARVMLYRGDLNETFCLAVGEAQSMGLPAVVQNLGSVVERVRDGETGFVTQDDASFADRAISLLKDEALWRRQHEHALAAQRAWGWPEAAGRFEELISQ
jgi:glycosyltransferase involved in cell wall biosynthesis